MLFFYLRTRSNPFNLFLLLLGFGLILRAALRCLSFSPYYYDDAS
jgi:hypothetical protein